jgi:hypothetical protein
VSPQPELSTDYGFSWKGFAYGIGADAYETKKNFLKMCPYGKLGDHLWVRETFVYRSKHRRYYYRADWPDHEPYAHDGWKPSIFMPREACRLVLEITEIRIQRLHEITEEDAIAEGVDCVSLDDVRRQATWSRRQDFSNLWNKINKKRGFGWDMNPWVWALTYNKFEGD